MGYSILRHRATPCNTRTNFSPLSKGNEVNIPQAGRGFCGNTNEPGDVGMNSWKSYLFFLTDCGLEIRLSRDKAVCLAEQLTLRAVRCAHDDP
jgi:hypothetical protein